MKIDRRKKYRIVLDTETCPLDNTIQEVSPHNMFVYDIGWAVVDKNGKVYKTQSYVVADIFLDEKDLMKSAYYANKIPNYWTDIKNGSRKLKLFKNIKAELYNDIAEYGVEEVYAHNARFDLGALNNTQRWLTKSRVRSYFPKNITVCDTLKMARQVVAKTPTYKKFCVDNGYLTSRNQVRLTAEILYRYITLEEDFEESHTALEDVMIEKEIMKYCFKKKKKMERKLWND